MSKERLLVAASAEQQLKLALELTRRAILNMTWLEHGVQAPLTRAKTAAGDLAVAEKQLSEMMKRIPIVSDK